MTVPHIGKATKRSYFGSEVAKQREGTIQATLLCVRAGLTFHMIDAEWKNNYMSADEFGNLLSLPSELASFLTLPRELDRGILTVLTVNARHTNALELTESYLEVIKQHENGGICFVAGNKAYLTDEEAQSKPGSKVKELVQRSREVLPHSPIFVGSEGLQALTVKLANKYSVIPFMLLDRTIEEKISILKEGNPQKGTAIYCPSYLPDQSDERSLVKYLGAYALRRGWVREALKEAGATISDDMLRNGELALKNKVAASILVDAIKAVALVEPDTVHQRLRAFSNLGVTYVALLLADDRPERFNELSKLLWSSQGEQRKS